MDELVELPQLTNVYLDNNPFAEADTYRGKMLRFLPQIDRLDGTICRDANLLRAPKEARVEFDGLQESPEEDLVDTV